VVADTLADLPPGEASVWTASNHDISRFPTRWCGGDERKARLALLVLATLPGTFVLYNGDEIAMTDVDVPDSLIRDLMRAETGAKESRDRARTPMPWDGSPTAGFTDKGVRPWLPYGEHASRNVAAQRADPDSTLYLSRELIALRRAEFGGQLASYSQLDGPPGVWAYQTGGLMVVANFTDAPVSLAEVGSGVAGPVLVRSDGPAAADTAAGFVGPWAGVITRQDPPPA
jgi:alpha-glucosidase